MTATWKVCHRGLPVFPAVAEAPGYLWTGHTEIWYPCRNAHNLQDLPEACKGHNQWH